MTRVATAEYVGAQSLRWRVAALLFFVTLINLVDRLTVSVLAPVITTQLGLSNLQFAGISTWFLVAYALSQAMSGGLFDRIGSRRGFAVSVFVWSIAAMAHAGARGIASLSFVRFVLGLGEGGNWPGAAKVIAEWFPVHERALGMSIVNAASATGSIIAPPLVIWLQLRFGWQATFLATGAMGLAWLAVWLTTYQSSERAVPTVRRIRWVELLKYRQVWALVLSRFLADPVWWLYLTWLPLYLYNARGFSLQQIGLFAWVPFLAADAGSLTGGWLSGHLISRGWTADKARKTVIVAGALLMTFGILAAATPSAAGALILIAIVLFGFQSWIGNVQTIPSDVFPEEVVASVGGLGGLGAGIGAILFTLTTGLVVDRFHSYTPILVVAGVLPLLATTTLFVLGGSIRRLRIDN